MQRSTLLGLLSTLVALFLLSSLPACEERPKEAPRPVTTYTPPAIQGAVTDTAGKLSAADDAQLEARIADYRRRTGNEIAVFIVGSLAGMPIEDVAYGAFNVWGIGKAGEDNGVLLVIAPNERRIRIETGKGIGHKLTDLEAAHILRERTGPLLKQDRLRDAIDATLDAIEAALDGRPPPPLGEVLAPKDAGAALSPIYVVDYASALDDAVLWQLENEARSSFAWRWFAIVIVPRTANIGSIRSEVVRRRRDATRASSTDHVGMDRNGYIVFLDATNRDVNLVPTSNPPKLAPDLEERLAEAARSTSSLEDAARAVAKIAAAEAKRLDELDIAETRKRFRELEEKKDGGNWLLVLGAVASCMLLGGLIAWRIRPPRASRDEYGGYDSSDSSSYSSSSSSYTSSYDYGSSSSSSYSSSSSSDESYRGGGGTSGGGGASDSY